MAVDLAVSVGVGSEEVGEGSLPLVRDKLLATHATVVVGIRSKEVVHLGHRRRRRRRLRRADDLERLGGDITIELVPHARVEGVEASAARQPIAVGTQPRKGRPAQHGTAARRLLSVGVRVGVKAVDGSKGGVRRRKVPREVGAQLRNLGRRHAQLERDARTNRRHRREEGAAVAHGERCRRREHEEGAAHSLHSVSEGGAAPPPWRRRGVVRERRGAHVDPAHARLVGKPRRRRVGIERSEQRGERGRRRVSDRHVGRPAHGTEAPVNVSSRARARRSAAASERPLAAVRGAITRSARSRVVAAGPRSIA